LTDSQFVETHLKVKLRDNQKTVLDMPSGILIRAHRRFGKTHCLLLKMAAQWMQNPDKRFYFFSCSERLSRYSEEEFNKIISNISLPRKYRRPEFRSLGKHSYQRLVGVTGDYFYLDDYDWADGNSQTVCLLNIILSGNLKSKPNVYYTAVYKVDNWNGAEIKFRYPSEKKFDQSISDVEWEIEWQLKN
jgi:hypothetical protein